jgi:hypothetical protein
MQFMDCHVSTQEMLADAAKRSEEVSQTCPHAFSRIGVDFKNIVRIVIARPFLASVRNRGMLAFDSLIRLVFIGEDMAVWQGETMYVLDQRFGLCRVNHSQANLPTRTPNGAQHRRTVIGVGTPSAPFVGSPTRGSMWTDALLTFFPPHFGRVRHSRLPNRGQASQVVNVRHFVEALAAHSERSGNSVPTPQPVRSWSRLSGCRAGAKPLAVA